MKKSIKFLAAAILGLAAVACSSPEKMAEMAERVIVTSNPAVLEVVGGEISADILLEAEIPGGIPEPEPRRAEPDHEADEGHGLQ